MAENDFKSNFVTSNIDKPLAELEELNNLVKKKKAEVRKAMFYAKHPDLLQAKKEFESKMESVNTEKFNEAIAENKKEPEKVQVKEQVKEQVKPETHREPETHRASEPEKPRPAPAPVKMVGQAPQHTHSHSVSRPLVVAMGSKWF